MIEIKNFLDIKTCKQLIDFINNNFEKTKYYSGRKLINLPNFKNNLFIEKIIKQYANIKPLDRLENIELICWDELGAGHDWHVDTIYYNTTSITYLNDDYSGGCTELKKYKIKPEIGKFVMFPAEEVHRVTKLKKGKRYVLIAWYKNI